MMKVIARPTFWVLLAVLATATLGGEVGLWRLGFGIASLGAALATGAVGIGILAWASTPESLPTPEGAEAPVETLEKEPFEDPVELADRLDASPLPVEAPPRAPSPEDAASPDADRDDGVE